MYPIDFLPEEYRHRRAVHRQQFYRLAALAMTAGILASASFVLHWRQSRLQEQLDLIEPVHSALSAQSKQLNTLQTHLQSARAMAELLGYLKHPWPRTQIMGQLFEPLPPTLMLHQLSIDRQAPENQPPPRPLSRSEQEAEKARLAAMLPPTRDLSRLRQECDSLQTVVRIMGVALDVQALHQYLAALEKVDLFTKVQLVNLERASDQEGLRFQVKLVVRPGYGQAGGPKPTQTASQPHPSGSPGGPSPSAPRDTGPAGQKTSLRPQTSSPFQTSQFFHLPQLTTAWSKL